MKKISLDGFEEFEKHTKLAGPSFTVIKGGRLNINKAAAKSFFKDSPHTLILYNPEKKLIALRTLEKPQKNSYPLKFAPSGVATLNCGAFFKRWGIDTSYKRDTKVVEFNKAEGIIFLKVVEDEK